MNRRSFLITSLACFAASRIGLSEAVPGQPAAGAANILPIAPERARDSYAIYSQLLRQTEQKECSSGCFKSGLRMIEDTTFVPEKPAVVSLDSYRSVPPIVRAMKLQNAIAVPSGREPDAAELLADYTRQNRQIFQLERRFHLPHRYRLLNEAGQHRYFGLTPGAVPANWHPDPAAVKEFKGVTTVYALSPVYFNPSKSLGLVFLRVYSGCMESSASVFERTTNGWQKLDWPDSRSRECA